MANLPAETIYVTLWARTDKVGSKCSHKIKVDRADWDAMSTTERDEYMMEEFWNSGIVDWGYQAEDYDGPG